MSENERNTAFGPGLPPLEEHRPGLVEHKGRQPDEAGEHRFPRKTNQAQVPRESLAARIARDARKEA
jgi:hypothetical protein